MAKQLTDSDLKRLATELLKRDPYKREFASPYYLKITMKMLIEAMQIALAAQEDQHA